MDNGHPLAALRIYLITDRSLFPTGGFLPAVEAALAGGVRALQLREKDLSPSALLALAREVASLTRKYGARLFINGRADVARIAGADGVHLPVTGLPAAAVKEYFPGLLAGVSTHSLDEARAAETAGADFITFGPVFDTPSKRQSGPPQGLGRLREVTRAVRIPVLALGGVDEQRTPSVLEAGAFGIGLISGIWKQPDIHQTVSEMILNFGGKSL